MLAELVNKSRQMQTETGNHFDSCSNKVAQSLTDQELLDLANETESKRFISNASRLVKGDDEGYRNHEQHHRDVAVMADGFIRKANRGE